MQMYAFPASGMFSPAKTVMGTCACIVRMHHQTLVSIGFFLVNSRGGVNCTYQEWACEGPAV